MGGGGGEGKGIHRPLTRTLSFCPVSSPIARVCVRSRVGSGELVSSEYSPVREPLQKKKAQQVRIAQNGE